eukprot:CAMPEP_0202889868 /NCGR_PEP_ID=MMETSP1392-20130828/419_1 /ASSEMBLY_ACC=CAM_ASM_000868 /TAXON_ID=225041 /ORGANISM="Chlamydomonas chlamydogama, Strain SAG 11-48b" /LENGTH=121 /DNA_ID=CAMNT_0049573299 /DNA_START=528 /DNA_END=890 /DNA_ORIENTATION=+
MVCTSSTLDWAQGVKQSGVALGGPGVQIRHWVAGPGDVGGNVLQAGRGVHGGDQGEPGVQAVPALRGDQLPVSGGAAHSLAVLDEGGIVGDKVVGDQLPQIGVAGQEEPDLVGHAHRGAAG